MSKQLRLDVAQLTDVGRKRPHNEDNMAYVIPKDPQVMTKKGALFIVADGMGGHAAGEVASEIAVDTVSYAYYQEDSDDIAVSLMHAIKRANTLIHQRAAENMLRSGMGTTCVAGVLRGSTAYIANVGDSRTYLVRNGQVRQISQDHSWVAEQVRAGLLTEEQARSHAQRNVITRCLGTQADVEVDLFAEELEEGDSFILCSDGLSGFVAEDDLRAIVNQYVPQESVYHLIERANENGGPDNITAIVVRVQEVGWEPPVARRNGHDITTQPTLIDAQTPEFALQGAKGRIPTAPLLGTVSAHPSESVTAPQPALQVSSRKRGRLLYPSLVLFILLVVVLVGGGIYYFLHINSPADFDGSVRKAQTLITQGKNEANTSPTRALHDLSKAQAILLSLQNNALTDTQQQQVKSLLDGGITEAVKSAAGSYNTQFSIMALSCTSKLTTPVENGSTNALASGIATIQGSLNTKPFSYVLGEDHNLYQLNDQPNGTKVLQGSYQLPATTQIFAIASDGVRILALTGPKPSSATNVQYSLLAMTPDTTGVLKAMNPAMAIDTKFMQGAYKPEYLTAWGMDVYIVLTSDTSPTSATLLHYTVENNKLVIAPGKGNETISTQPLASIAAFPNHQLFLLTKSGNVQSLTFSGGTQALPTPVSIDQNVASPLPFTVEEFSASKQFSAPDVPQSQSPQTLQLISAKYLVAGAVGNISHLYVVDDSMYHRVLDFEISKGAATPAIAASTATPGANVTPTPAAPVTMKLDRQYTSTHLFTNVRGIVPDPKNPLVYLIAQNDPNPSVRNFITVNTTANVCTP